MIIKTNTIKIPHSYVPEKEHSIPGFLYFDIETTGFSSRTEKIYLIGVVSYINNYHYSVLQWFDDDNLSEKEILNAFISYCKDFHTLISFNGNNFDVPFIAKRAELYGLSFNYNGYTLYDIYEKIRPLKKYFSIENLKQKTIEKFLGICREDIYDGGKLISIYKDYLITKDKEKLSFLLLHNYDDITGLVKITDILSYYFMINGDFFFESVQYKGLDNILITCKLKHPLNIPISYMMNKTGHDCIYFSAESNTLKILLTVNHDEYKYFYDNYKDYYYLPLEDMAIHKSVAAYVDSSCREKAKKNNCYIKKHGNYVIQLSSIFSPLFRNYYNSKESYFSISSNDLEIKDFFSQNDNLVHDYVLDLLKNI